MKRSLLCCALIASLSSGCKVAEVHVSPGIGWSALDGGVAASDLDELGELRESTLDGLGIGARRSIEQLSVSLSEGGHSRWDFFAQASDFVGTGELADDLLLEGVQILYDEGDVNTDLSFGHYGLRWVREVARRGDLRVGVGAGLTVVDLDVSFEQPDTAKAVSREALLPVPLPVLDLIYDREVVDAHLSISAMKVWDDEGEGHVIDLDFSASVHVLDDLGELVFGYRELELELEHSGSERARVDVSLDGPYVAFRMGF